MNQIIKNPIVLNTFSASAATDISTSGGFINISGVPKIYYPTANASIQAAVAEVVGVALVTFTSTASTTYKFVISQPDLVSGDWNEYQIEYASGASTSAAIISAAINKQILQYSNLMGGSLFVTSSGGSTTITITGVAGHPVFKVTAGSNTTVVFDGTGGSTVPVVAKGTAAQVNATPNVSGTAVSGHIYTKITFNGNAPTSSMLTTRGTTGYQQVLFLDENATNFAAFLTGITNVLNGLKVTGSVADPELISAM